VHYALSPDQVQAVMDVFLFSGIVFLIIGSACAFFLSVPPADYARPDSAPASTGARSYTTMEMLRTPQFYLLWLMLFINVAAGILVIGNALPIMQELTGSTPKLVAAIYGSIALFNALGRFFWGAVSDRIGRNLAYVMILGLQAGVFLAIGGLHAPVPVAAAYAVVLLCFGGGFGTMPSFNADYFGTKHMGANYGAILTAWGLAGIAGPLFASMVKDLTGSFSGALLPTAIMLSVAVVLPLLARKPTHFTRKKTVSTAALSPR
jgi:MFS transporter, OFA family, oxalate/formate antiporter